MNKVIIVILASVAAAAAASQPLISTWERQEIAEKQASQQRQDILNGYYSPRDLLEDAEDEIIEEYQVSEQHKHAAHANTVIAQAYGRS